MFTVNFTFNEADLNLSTSHEAQLHMSAALQSQLHVLTSDPLMNYALLSAMEKAVQMAKDAFQDDATQRAEEIHRSLGCQEARITYNGLLFDVKHADKYDYKGKEYNTAKHTVDVIEKELKAAKTNLKAKKEQFEITHKPVSTKITIAFICKK